MPTYEYLCRSCGDRIEVVQSFSDDPLTVCAACGGELRKVFSAAGLIFKGSGWHIKDYAGSSSSGGTSSSPSSPPGASSTTPSSATTASSGADTGKASGAASGGTASGDA